MTPLRRRLAIKPSHYLFYVKARNVGTVFNKVPFRPPLIVFRMTLL